MDPQVSDDFAEFVAARWPDLEAVAALATLDRRVAREVTAAAFADLRADWADAPGAEPPPAPTTAVHRALLLRLTALRPQPPATGPRMHDAVAPVTEDVVGTDPDGPVPRVVTDALSAVLVAEPPAVRAALGATVLWHLADGEVSGLLGASAGAVLDGVRAARLRLVAAHRESLLAAGRPVDDDRLDEDLAQAIGLLAVPSAPADPVRLVDRRLARIRRRTLVVGGASALVAGGAAWWALGSAIGGLDRVRGASGTARAARASRDVWARTATWPPRGGLTDDVGVQALVIRSRVPARLLWADDVHGTRVVVATRLDGGPPSSTRVLVWVGAQGSAAERLEPVGYRFDALYGREDVVALGVPTDTGGLLVLLGRPSVRRADFSAAVRPTPEGEVDRVWSEVALAGGVGTAPLESPWGGAARVLCGGFDGGPLSPGAWTVAAPANDPAAALVLEVSAAVGAPRSTLDGRLLVDSALDVPVPGSGITPAAVDRGRAVLAQVVTADGAVVRSASVWGVRRAEPSQRLVLGPLVVPASAADGPFVVRLDDPRPRIGRFLVAVPGGGATCQLLATSPSAYPVSRVVPMTGDAALVEVVNADDASAFRLVVEDADGRRTHDAVPPIGRDLYGGPAPGET